MKMVFMGTPEFAVPILEALNHHYEITLVVTQPDRPTGRRRTMTPPPVKTMAQSLGLPVFQPERVRRDYGPILDANPDVIVTAAYGQIIPKALLDTPPFGAINVHGSLLPALRGGAPVQRAIERGHKQTGVTIMAMNEAMDAGDIIAQATCEIEPRETAGSLFAKLSVLGRALLLKTLPQILDRTAPRMPQEESEATFAYTLKKEEEQLDLTLAAQTLDAKIRAFHPTPNTYVIDPNGVRLKILTAHPSHATTAVENNPGEIVAIDAHGVHVLTGEGLLCLTTVQPAGKKAMKATDYARGAGRDTMQIGQLLGKL
ncbi:MAG: methionyl-tRNA formyltransferase [Acholeplasmatales bacterium]|nr:MAG: methionyl-tRNA formyltransferase [Acholeplasmatales bacterium]